MDVETDWSPEECGWVPSRADAGLYWSVQRCRWEAAGGAADALATPWSMFQAVQGEVEVPQQRAPQEAPVGA